MKMRNERYKKNIRKEKIQIRNKLIIYERQREGRKERIFVCNRTMETNH